MQHEGEAAGGAGQQLTPGLLCSMRERGSHLACSTRAHVSHSWQFILMLRFVLHYCMQQMSTAAKICPEEQDILPHPTQSRITHSHLQIKFTALCLTGARAPPGKGNRWRLQSHGGRTGAEHETHRPPARPQDGLPFRLPPLYCWKSSSSRGAGGRPSVTCFPFRLGMRRADARRTYPAQG